MQLYTTIEHPQVSLQFVQKFYEFLERRKKTRIESLGREALDKMEDWQRIDIGLEPKRKAQNFSLTALHARVVVFDTSR